MSIAGADPRTEFISSLDLSSCRIEFSPSHIVLLCGGHVPPPKDNPDAEDPSTASMRHAISNTHTNFEIFRPEEIDNWHTDGTFKDLVSFELELAALCSLVVIIPESEGSLVELGAFSQIPELIEKTIVIGSSQFSQDKSFINLGILRFLQSGGSDRVKIYPWKLRNPHNIDNEVVGDIVSDIEDNLNKLPKTQVLKPTQRSHSSILICELLRFFVVLKENEILDYLKLLGFILSRDELRGKLFLLECFQFIKIQHYSDAFFYTLRHQPPYKLRTAFTKIEQPFDEIRLSVQCRNFYEKEKKYRNWHRAISLLQKPTL